jgi:hypothetical protein
VLDWNTCVGEVAFVMGMFSKISSNFCIELIPRYYVILTFPYTKIRTTQGLRGIYTSVLIIYLFNSLVYGLRVQISNCLILSSVMCTYHKSSIYLVHGSMLIIEQIIRDMYTLYIYIYIYICIFSHVLSSFYLYII